MASYTALGPAAKNFCCSNRSMTQFWKDTFECFARVDEWRRKSSLQEQRLYADIHGVETTNGVEISFTLFDCKYSPPHTKMTRILLHGIDVHGRLFCRLEILHELVPFCPVDCIRRLVDIQRV